mgnify:FL=1
MNYNCCNLTLVFSLLLAIITVSCNAVSEIGLRQKVNINNGWQYLEHNARTVDEALTHPAWQEIDLPHTWNAKDATDLTPGYRRDGSWYRKEIKISKISADEVYQLHFEGVNISSKVYVNGKNVGEHIGGYIGFNVDISKALREGKNEILVYVNNGYNPEVIPSQKSDFFIYGGITRDVWLKKLPSHHIEDIKITTPEVTNSNAKLNAKVSISTLMFSLSSCSISDTFATRLG